MTLTGGIQSPLGKVKQEKIDDTYNLAQFRFHPLIDGKGKIIKLYELMV